MRLPAAAASILAIGLIVAACGGDDATPEPADEATAAPAATEAAEEPAEEVTEAPAAEATEAPAEEVTDAPAAEPTEAAAAEFGKKAQHASTDDPATTYALTSGRYRMEWRTTDCEQVDILVSQVDGDFSYSKPSRSTYATVTINDLPEGTYKIEQLDPGCADWSVRVDWMTN